MTFQRFCYFISHPLFVIVWFGLALISYFYFDLSLAIYFHHLSQKTPNVYKSFSILTDFGTDGTYLTIAGLLILAALVIRNNRILHSAILVLISQFLSKLLSTYIKIGTGRARPLLYFNQDLYGFYFFKHFNDMWSFPSGHERVVAAAATAFSFLLPRYWGVFFMIAFIVGASRIIVTAHYLSDVMIGFYLGFIVSYGLYLLAKRFNLSTGELHRSFDKSASFFNLLPPG